jgi:hypothetical protein
MNKIFGLLVGFFCAKITVEIASRNKIVDSLK